MLQYRYPDTGRKLRQLVTGLLKSGMAQEVLRINYVKSYTLVGGKIQKQEEKILQIFSDPEQEEKIKNFIKKQAPEAKIQ
jgi:hypothetical protein